MGKKKDDLDLEDDIEIVDDDYAIEEIDEEDSILDGDALAGLEAMEEGLKRQTYPPDSSDLYNLEILSNELENTSELNLDFGDGDTFEITRDDDPLYDIYPIGAKRPVDLFKHPLFSRQLGEDRDSYQKFLLYASLPPAKRTTKKAWVAWREYNDLSPTTPPSGHYRDLANHWRWIERAYALDLHRQKIVQKVWLERDIERREQDWMAGGELRDKAFRALDTLEADDLGPSSIAKFFALASELQNKAIPDTGLNTDDFSSLLESLPKDRRDRIIEIVVAKAKIT